MAETTSRTPRDLGSRALTERVQAWRPPETLPEPDRQPGYEYRWVRTSLLGNDDARNLSTRIREGWEPVSISEQPKFKMLLDPNSRIKDAIEIGGLVLCKMPSEMVEQRRQYYENRNQQAMLSVDNNFMSQNDPRMPLIRERKTKVTFGQGE